MTSPIVSVAVSSWQGRARLPGLIEALERQTLDRDSFEVIIVDDASTDGAIDVLRELEKTAKVNLRAIRLEVNDGPSAGRNAAWRGGRAPIVAFTDDDCLPTPTWLESGLAAMRDAEIVAGRTAPRPDQLHLLGPFSRTMDTTDARWLATCNIFYRREDLEAVGGFDEAFENHKGGEDTDLGWRIRALGRRVAFAPDALVYHDVRASSFRYFAKETLRWDGIARLVAKHPREARSEHLWKRVFWRRSHPKAILAMAGLVLGLVFPPALVLMLPYVNYRLRVEPRTWKSRSARVLLFPATFLIDALEVYVMVQGSIRFRTFVL